MNTALHFSRFFHALTDKDYLPVNLIEKYFNTGLMLIARIWRSIHQPIALMKLRQLLDSYTIIMP